MATITEYPKPKPVYRCPICDAKDAEIAALNKDRIRWIRISEEWREKAGDNNGAQQELERANEEIAKLKQNRESYIQKWRDRRWDIRVVQTELRKTQGDLARANEEIACLKNSVDFDNRVLAELTTANEHIEKLEARIGKLEGVIKHHCDEWDGMYSYDGCDCDALRAALTKDD